MRNVMIDLETMGLRAGCAIVALGAVEFDVPSGQIKREFSRSISLKSNLDFGLTVDGETVEWWLKQSDAAREALLGNPQFLGSVLSEFARWIPDNAIVWAHGASFDIPILDAAYAKVFGSVPWKYRNVRDTRTLFSLVDGVEIKNAGTAHNALDDARAQALAVISAYRSLAK